MRIRMGCTNLETVSCFDKRDVEPYIKPFHEAVGHMRGSHGSEPRLNSVILMQAGATRRSFQDGTVKAPKKKRNLTVGP